MEFYVVYSYTTEGCSNVEMIATKRITAESFIAAASTTRPDLTFQLQTFSSVDPAPSRPAPVPIPPPPATMPVPSPSASPRL